MTLWENWDILYISNKSSWWALFFSFFFYCQNNHSTTVNQSKVIKGKMNGINKNIGFCQSWKWEHIKCSNWQWHKRGAIGAKEANLDFFFCKNVEEYICLISNTKMSVCMNIWLVCSSCKVGEMSLWSFWLFFVLHYHCFCESFYQCFPDWSRTIVLLLITSLDILKRYLSKS